MRPFTKAVFSKEGKDIIGYRWTREQVQQAYEKADELLDILADCRKDEYTKQVGLEQHGGVRAVRLMGEHLIKCPDETTQQLAVTVLTHLLERGLDVAATIAKIYKTSPKDFRDFYASSKQAFLKDKFFCRQVPVSSFEPFKMQENPAISKDERLSGLCAHLYIDPYPCAELERGVFLIVDCDVGAPGASSAAKLFHATRWIQRHLYRQNPEKPIDKSNLKEVIRSRKPESRE